MWQITVWRMLLISSVGIILYWLILYVVGWGESRKLKRRRKTTAKEQESFKAKIVLIYLFALFAVITLCFLTIKYWIGGVK